QSTPACGQAASATTRNAHLVSAGSSDLPGDAGDRRRQYVPADQRALRTRGSNRTPTHTFFPETGSMKLRPLLFGVAIALLGVVLQIVYMRRFEQDVTGGAKVDLLVAA